jgi:hypothetical protein
MLDSKDMQSADSSSAQCLAPHLEFGIGESGLWIRDCASTNGSEIELNDHRIVIEPGVRVAAPPGRTIHMGARQVKVWTISGPVTIGKATIDWGGATHVGAVRKHNEDTFCAGPPVFVVADGVGGHFAATGNDAQWRDRDSGRRGSVLDGGQYRRSTHLSLGFQRIPADQHGSFHRAGTDQHGAGSLLLPQSPFRCATF